MKLPAVGTNPRRKRPASDLVKTRNLIDSLELAMHVVAADWRLTLHSLIRSEAPGA
jgi:hypothetical protein